MKRSSTIIRMITLMMALSIFSLPTFAEVLTENFKLLASDGISGDEFGKSVGLSAGILAVGAPFDEDYGHHSGAAYLFDVATDAQLFKLLPDDGAADDYFGYSLAIDDGIVVVGARKDDAPYTDSGSAYIFDATTGVQLHKLVPTDISTNKEFGFYVAIDNGIVAITGAGDGANGAYAGAVYLFDAETGNQLFKILPDDGSASDGLGISIAMQNGLLLVGSYHDDDNGSNSGSAYLFDTATGEQLAKLLPEDGTADDEFGISVAIENNTLVVGARYEYYNFGAVYIFDATTYAQTLKIKPNELHQNTKFGGGVAISNNVVAVSEQHSDWNNDNAGSVFLFDATTGDQLNRLQPSDSITNHYFGYSIAMDNGVLVCGAIGDEDNGFASGAVYGFEVGGEVPTAVPQITYGMELLPNFPNPFNPSTSIRYRVDFDGQLELAVYSARGELVRTLVSEFQVAGGVRTVMWDGKDEYGLTQSSGVYYARLVSNEKATLRKMVLLK
jgi:hypothetical protein